MNIRPPPPVHPRRTSVDPPPELVPLIEKVKAQHPNAEVAVDGPSQGGYWWVDFYVGEKDVNLEWRPKTGFGVSYPPHFPFTGPDEVIQDLDAAVAAILKGLE